MTPEQQLYLVLLLLYAFDCLVWIRSHAIGFAGRTGASWGILAPRSAIGNSAGAFRFLPFAPPLKASYIGEVLPFSISPDGLSTASPHDFSLQSCPVQTSAFITWDDLKSAKAVDRIIYLNGQRWIKCSTSAHALWTSKTLETLIHSDPQQREETLQAILADMFDTMKIREKISACLSHTRGLRILQILYFVFLLVASPLLVWWFGFVRILYPFVGTLIGLHVLTLSLFWMAHKRQYPAETGERALDLFKMLFCPPMAVRASDHVSLGALAGFHPVALAQVLCEREDYVSLARQILLELSHPLALEHPHSQCEETFRWCSEQLVRRLTESLEQAQVTPNEILLPTLNNEHKSYCPRCQSGYLIPEGVCTTCRGVTLLPAPQAESVSEK